MCLDEMVQVEAELEKEEESGEAAPVSLRDT